MESRPGYVPAVLEHQRPNRTVVWRRCGALWAPLIDKVAGAWGKYRSTGPRYFTPRTAATRQSSHLQLNHFLYLPPNSVFIPRRITLKVEAINSLPIPPSLAAERAYHSVICDTMPVFQAPPMPHSKNEEWRRIAKPGFRDPKVLWTDYWQRFNTMTIAVQDEDAYFADAVAAAKVAQTRDHLEELLAEKHEQRCRELQDVRDEIFCAAFSPRTRMPSEAVRRAALKAVETGTLDSLLQFVCGVVFGWKGSEGEDESRIDGGGQSSDAVGAWGDSGAPRDPKESVGDAYEYENKFPPDMLPSPDWAQDDKDWNEAMKYRVYECDDGDGAFLEDGSLAATGRGEGRDEGPDATSASPPGTLRGSSQKRYRLRRHTCESGMLRRRRR